MPFSALSRLRRAASEAKPAHMRRLAGYPVARVQDLFDKFLSELGFYSISTIFRALVRQNDSSLSHECRNGHKRLVTTCDFVPSA